MLREATWEYEEIPDTHSSLKDGAQEYEVKEHSKRQLSEGALKSNSNEYFMPFTPITFEAFKASDSFGPYRFYEDEIRKPPNARIPVHDTSKLMVKMISTTGQIVEGTLKAHGFLSTNSDCNVLWTGAHLKGSEYRDLKLNPYQKINHFPGSADITRKDKLYQQIARMQQTYGMEEYGFIPRTFLLPAERDEALREMERNPNDNWILKPVGSSRGRGIYLVGRDRKLGEEKKCVVSKYIDNPLLIDERKFDIRIYALVTSFEPLVVYIYQEGLARFATEKYKSATQTHNRFVHLTNYSVNKMNKSKFIPNQDENEDGVGSKWSYAALASYFKSKGINFEEVIQSKIHDVVIKTFLSAKISISSSVEKIIPYRGNCFELFGFDIMFDEQYKPWLLEVNLSPSLTCDSPLDHKVKATLVTDIFNMVGVVPCPLLYAQERSKQDTRIVPTKAPKEDILRIVKEENERRGRWMRVYPAENYKKYNSLFKEAQTPLNEFICKSVIGK